MRKHMKRRIATAFAALTLLRTPLAHAQQSFDFTPGSTQVIETGTNMNINYAQDGWTFVSQGTHITVTAPPQEASTTVTVPGIGDLQLNSTTSATKDIQSQINDAAGQGNTPPPEDQTGTDTDETKYFDLEATIDGQNVTSQLQPSQALALAPYANLDRSSLTATYSDANGTQIPLKSHSVDEKKMSAVLTVQEGFTPANPSILRIIDSSTGHVVVGAKLTDPNYKQQTLDGKEVNSNSLPKTEKINTGDTMKDLATAEVSQGIPVWVAAVGAVLFLLLIVVVGVLFSSRRKLKQLKKFDS